MQGIAYVVTITCMHTYACSNKAYLIRLTLAYAILLCLLSLPFRLEFDFTMGEWLGKGGFGHVYEVTSRTDGGSYALKIVRLPDK